jgi:hypothetical protein
LNFGSDQTRGGAKSGDRRFAFPLRMTLNCIKSMVISPLFGPNAQVRSSWKSAGGP